MANEQMNVKKTKVVLPNQSFAKVPDLGTPAKVKGEYVYKEQAIVGKSYVLTCPECSHRSLVKSEKTGSFRLKCKACGTSVLLKIIDKKEEVAGNPKPTIKFEIKPKAKSLAGGMFTWGRFLNQKKAVLREGTVYIGRNDYDEPSDISIDDSYISRRSIRVDTTINEEGFLAKITLERTSNLVLVNGKNLAVGESVYLNYGDTIKLGNTTLTFKKSS